MNIDQLRAALIERGYREAGNGLAGRDNECKTYFYRKTGLDAAVCECNEKPADQVVIYPFAYSFMPDRGISVQLEVCGESGGIWFKLQAYSLSCEELLERLSEIESRLVAAWNGAAARDGMDAQIAAANGAKRK